MIKLKGKMASAQQQKRPLETNENSTTQEPKRIKQFIRNYSVNDCIEIPEHIKINDYLRCFDNLRSSTDYTVREYQTKLLQETSNNAQTYVYNVKTDITNTLYLNNNSILMKFIHDFIKNDLIIFLQMNIYYIYYTTEENGPYITLINKVLDLIKYFNIIYVNNVKTDITNTLNHYYTSIYLILKQTKFNDLTQNHFYYSNDYTCLSLNFCKGTMNIHLIITRINTIIKYNVLSKHSLINNLILRKINYNFKDISKKIRENINIILKYIELEKLKKYIIDLWFNNSKNYVKQFMKTNKQITLKDINDDIIKNYISKYPITNTNCIQNYIKNIIDKGLKVIIPTINSLINKLNKDILKYIETFKILKTKITRYNYNGNLDNLQLYYYFRNGMNIIKDPEIHDKEIILSNFYDILDKNTKLKIHYKANRTSYFNITYDYYKYNKIIPNFYLYFANPLNNPYWSIKNNIYPNNNLIITILCINNYNYYNTTKSLIPYVPDELWFLTFSYLKLYDLSSIIDKNTKKIFD